MLRKKDQAETANAKDVKKGKTGKKGKAPQSTTEDAKHANVNAYLIKMIVSAVLGFAACVSLLEFLVIQPTEQASAATINQRSTDLLVNSINQNVKLLRSQVKEASETQLIKNSTAQGANEIAVTSDLSQIIPFAEKVYLFPKGGITRKAGDGTRLGFANLDLLRRTEKGEDTHPEAFLLENTWKLQISSPVALSSGELIGTLLVVFNPSIFSDLVANVKGGVHLLQRRGDKESAFLTSGQLSEVVVNKNTSVPGWVLQYSPEEQLQIIDRTMLYLSFVIGTVVSILLLSLLWNDFIRKLRKDLIAMTAHISQNLEGSNKKRLVVQFGLIYSVANKLELLTRGQTKKASPPAADAPSQSTAPAQSDEAKTSLEKTTPETTGDIGVDLIADDEDVLGMSSSETVLEEDSDGALFDGVDLDDLSELDGVDLQESQQIAIAPEIFRAYDIRGIVGETLTSDVITYIGRAIGSEAIKRGLDQVCVGYDGRASSPDFAQSLIAGLTDTGCNVISVGLVPTPVLYFAAHTLSGGSGVMITGSHNPPQYNGIKTMLGGETLAEDAIQRLYARITHQEFVQGSGTVSEQDVQREYVDTILNDIAVAAPLRVVVDAGNGVAGNLAPMLLEELGCEVVPLHCEVDGNFPNHHPDPSRPENLADLIAAVESEAADLGIAFDGDGDRIGVVTNEGKIIWPDRLLMLFAKDVVSRNPGADIIFDVKCSRRLINLVGEYGGRPIMWKTGHSLIKAKMAETGALLAGEMSGHIFFKERWFGFDDGLYSAARLLEILGLDERDCHEVFDAFPEDVSTPEINVAVAEDKKFAIVEKLSQSNHFGEGSVSTIDGVRVDYPDGWGLCRASNTSPVLVLRFEADSDDALQRIIALFKNLLSQIDSTLELNF